MVAIDSGNHRSKPDAERSALRESRPPRRIRPVLATLFDAPIVTVTATGAHAAEPLRPEEAACIGRAAPRRRSEFGTGRACAREALARLGIHDFPLLVGPSRAPVWPRGVVGSLSHCRGYCGVAVARSDAVLGLGLDVERAEPLERELLERICTAGELERLPELAADPHAPDWGKLTFCAKESAYKCYFPLAGVFLGFQDVEIDFEPRARRFRARLVRPDAPAVHGLRALEGRFAWSEAFVFAGVTLRAPALGAAAL
jgi:4'-phosphopantetheinyl transferase EntD